MIEELQKKLSLPDEDVSKVKVWEVNANKLYKELSPDFSVASINEFIQLYAEKQGDDDIPQGEDERWIKCYHFQKEANKSHGVPFKFVVKEV